MVLPCDALVVCVGCWCRDLGGVFGGVPVSPRKGQVLVLENSHPVLERNVMGGGSSGCDGLSLEFIATQAKVSP
jgi:glycine/D-amino acid oxidase-like deaminating enzyme